MANEITTTSLNDIVDTMIARAGFYFKKAGVLPPLVTRQTLLGFPGKAVDFPKWDAKASSDVQTGTEGGEYTTNLEITTSVVTATVAEYLLRSVISDLVRDSSTEDVYAGVGATLGNAMALKLDDTIVALFGSFSQTVAGAATALALDHIFQAVQFLENAGSPRPYHGVWHPKQVWGPKGLSGIFDISAVSSAANANVISEQFVSTGVIGSVAGLTVNSTTEIDDNVGAGGDAAGAVFSARAIGLADKGLMNVKVEESAGYRGAIFVMQGLWKEVEINANDGVYALTDVS